jgi:hypothetical protein
LKEANYNQNMMEHKNLVCIGQMAVFYIPTKKLLDRMSGKIAGEVIHDFLIENYDAYTFVVGRSEGYWRRGKTDPICHDVGTKYEVSFGGKERIPEFIDFLSTICRDIGEEAIYLTMGKSSYFVTPKEQIEV